MIFVTVGTQKFSFNRLLKNIDDLVEAKEIQDDVFAQIGHSTYLPKHYKYETFISKEEFDSKIAQCDIVITHSGIGSIMSALNNHKPIIVCPRLAKFNEHVDNHQLEIAYYFAQAKYVLMCNENDSLIDVIKAAETYKFAEYKSKQAKAIETISEYLNSLKLK